MAETILRHSASHRRDEDNDRQVVIHGEIKLVPVMPTILTQGANGTNKQHQQVSKLMDMDSMIWRIMAGNGVKGLL